MDRPAAKPDHARPELERSSSLSPSCSIAAVNLVAGRCAALSRGLPALLALRFGSLGLLSVL